MSVQQNIVTELLISVHGAVRFIIPFAFWIYLIQKIKVLKYGPCTYETCPIVAKAKEGT